MARTEDQDTNNSENLITKTLLDEPEEANGVSVSSESESSIAKITCPHVNKSTNSKNVKKFNPQGFSSVECNVCKIKVTPNESEDKINLELCLQCGFCFCVVHASKHFDKPHSDQHNLFLKLSNWSVWCYKCGFEIPLESSGKLGEEIKVIKQHHNKSTRFQLKPVVNKLVPENSTTTSEMDSSTSSRNLNLSSSYSLNSSLSLSSPMPHVRGLSNLGNTCFFNSVLQCLAQTPFLLEILLEIKEPGQKVCIDVDDNNQMVAELDEWGSVTRALANTLSEITQPTGGVFSPGLLLDALRSRCRYFIGFNQHDAHELLRQLLDSVKMEDIRRYRVQILQYFGLSKKVNPDEVDEKKRILVKQLNQKLTDTVNIRPDPVFKGTLVSTVQCTKCFHTSEVIESFLDLSLSVSFDKPQPAVLSRRKNTNSYNDNNSNNEIKGKSKHQKKKEKKAARRANKLAKFKKRWKDEDVNVGEIPAVPQKHDINESGYSSSKPSSPVQTNGNLVSNDVDRNEILAEAFNEVNSSSYTYNSVNEEENKNKETAFNIFDFGNNLDIDSTSSMFINEKQTKSNDIQNEIATAAPGLFPITNHIKNEFNEESEASCSSLSSDVRFRPSNSVQNNSVIKSGSSSGGSVSNDDDKDEDEDDDDEADAEGDDCSAEEDTVDCPMETPETIITLQPTGEYDDSSILSCLSQFTACEILTGNNKVCCESCTDRHHKNTVEDAGNSNIKKKPVYQPATKQLLINYLPPVLILHLKRFQAMCYSFKKVPKFIAYPLILDIAPFCSIKCPNLLFPGQNKVLYSLYGIVEHMGSLSGGHYVAYVKIRRAVEKNSYRRFFLPSNYHPSSNHQLNKSEIEQKLMEFENSNSAWFCISDSFVKAVSVDDVMSKQAYLLFYERIL